MQTLVWCIEEEQKFEWTLDHEKAFQELKNYLSSTPLLAKHEDEELSFLYLIESKNAASTLLVKDLDGTQHNVYYVSKSFWMLRLGTHILKN